VPVLRRRSGGPRADDGVETGARPVEPLRATSRGSTAEERDAAVAWLEEAARSEHQIAVKPPAATPPDAVKRTRRVRARRPHHTSAPRNGPATPTPITPPAPLPQVEALQRQQQRILRRSALIDYVLAAERQRGQTLTLGEALAELVANISEAARTIGTLLQIANGPPRTAAAR
jgi:hypothetical protein